MAKQRCRMVNGVPTWSGDGQAAPGRATQNIVSDHYGCTLHTVDEMRIDAALNGLNVEFKPDPTMIENGKALFYQAHFANEAERDRYAARFGERDYGQGGSASAMTKPELDAAAKRMLSLYPRRCSDRQDSD